MSRNAFLTFAIGFGFLILGVITNTPPVMVIGGVVIGTAIGVWMFAEFKKTVELELSYVPPMPNISKDSYVTGMLAFTYAWGRADEMGLEDPTKVASDFAAYCAPGKG